jgi:hypothetical protein
MKDFGVVKEWLVRFKNLKTLKGVTDYEFDPLETFIEHQKKIPAISWTIMQKTEHRERLFKFLEANDT